RGIKSMINSIEQRTDTRKHASNHSRFSRDHRNPSPKIKIGDSGHSQSRTGATRNRNSGHFGSRGSESKSSDSNSNLTQDTGDFISDTYQATRMGWEIANDDPQRTADRLMNDEKFQKDLCRTGDNLMNSSKRMNKHLDKASKTTKKAADSVKKALGW
ncbi:MAG: hypothetical protein KJ831_10705, partial [Candidatus Eisenbacteria bacterium]|nr:hypothetical protein [Candidatus Eisenbacteria bacterium]